MKDHTKTDAPSGFGRKFWAFLGNFCLLLLLWLQLINFPLPPAAGLDPSWRMTLGYALKQKLQYGTDIVFTYGPLGYLLPATNSGGHYLHYIVWQLGANALFAVLIWAFGRGLQGWRRAAYYVFFLGMGLNFGDTVHLMVILLLAVSLLREPVASRRWLAACVLMLMALLSLVKFTNLMLAGFAVACLTVHHAVGRRWTDLAVTVGAYAAAFLAGWVLWDQRLANLPAYLINSLNASNAYGDGMCIYESDAVFYLGLTSALCTGVYYLLSLVERPDRSRAATMMLIAAAASFMNWKHGYIRADGHVFAHYIMSMLVVVSYPVLLLDHGPWQRSKQALLGLAAASTLAGAYLVSPSAVTDFPATWNYKLKATINALRILPDFPRNARAEYESVSRSNTLAGLKARIGDATVDMLGSEQSYILFAGLRFTPRPVLQSYFTYSERLLRLNEAFYRSDRAPEFVVQRMDTIDFRLPAQDDSLALRQIYRHYRFITNEAGFLIWRKQAADPSLDRSTPIENLTTTFGQAVTVPEHGEDPIWAEIVVRPTLLGKLRAFLYKAPIITMRVKDRGGNDNEYRLIREMAATGFLLYPHFTSSSAVEQYERGNPGVRVDRFSIELPAEARKYYRDDIEVRFSRLPPFPRQPPPDIVEITPSKFRMFDRAPASANALYPCTPLLEGDKEVMSAHPPSEIVFNVDFPAQQVTGSYGIGSAAYTPPNRTDGVEFIINWMGADGVSRRLLHRYLQPATQAADRGFQNFAVTLPKGGGRLILQTTPGPNNDLSYDWAFWTDIKFVP